MSGGAVRAGLSLAGSRQKAASVTAAPRTAIDYAHLLSIAVPLAVAVLIFFQVHIPVGTGYLNVNLAEPFALLGGAFLAVRSAVYLRRWPDWRIRWMNAHLLSAVVVITAALLIGAGRFGWTDRSEEHTSELQSLKRI